MAIWREKGEHLGIYHIGTPEEVSIADLAHRIADLADSEIALIPANIAPGAPCGAARHFEIGKARL